MMPPVLFEEKLPFLDLIIIFVLIRTQFAMMRMIACTLSCKRLLPLFGLSSVTHTFWGVINIALKVKGLERDFFDHITYAIFEETLGAISRIAFSHFFHTPYSIIIGCFSSLSL